MNKIRKKRNVNLVLFHQFFNTLGNGVLNVFLPILIYMQTADLLLSVAFMAAEFFFQIVSNIVFKQFLIKHGFIAMLIHVLFVIAAQAIIIIVAPNALSIWVVIGSGFCAGISQAFYFAPIHMNFAFADKQVDTARFVTAEVLGKALMILISTYILHSELQHSNYLALGISSALYLISIIPLAKYITRVKRHFKAGEKLTVRQVAKQFRRNNFYHVCLGVSFAVIRYMLPLYLYVEHLNLKAVGLVLAGAELLRIVGAYLAKFLVSKKKLNLCMLIATLISIFSCVAIVISRIPLVDFILATLLLFTTSMTFVATFGNYIKRVAAAGGLFNGVLLRELCIHTSKLAIVGLFVLFFSFPVVFIVGAVNNLGLFAGQYRKKPIAIPETMPSSIYEEEIVNENKPLET